MAAFERERVAKKEKTYDACFLLLTMLAEGNRCVLVHSQVGCSEDSVPTIRRLESESRDFKSNAMRR